MKDLHELKPVQDLDSWLYTCDVCGWSVRTQNKYDAMRHWCKQEVTPCIHLGPILADTAFVLCETCEGRVLRKREMNTCSVHGDCMPGVDALGRRGKDTEVEDIMGCEYCRENKLGYEPKETK